MPGPAIAAAMELMAGTYALIIDMRHNGGGAPEASLLCSSLFDGEPPISTRLPGRRRRDQAFLDVVRRARDPLPGTCWATC